MTSYVNRQFRKGTTHFSVFADESQIIVEISCHNFNFKNFWGGEFLSTWTFNVTEESLSGTTKIHNHYFEQGNIQFNIGKSLGPFTVKSATGRLIVDQIAKQETKY